MWPGELSCVICATNQTMHSIENSWKEPKICGFIQSVAELITNEILLNEGKSFTVRYFDLSSHKSLSQLKCVVQSDNRIRLISLSVCIYIFRFLLSYSSFPFHISIRNLSFNEFQSIQTFIPGGTMKTCVWTDFNTTMYNRSIYASPYFHRKT